MTETETKNWKARFDKVAALTKLEWTSTRVHQMVAAGLVLDLAGIKDAKTRDLVFGRMDEFPSGLGCNASGFAKTLGAESKKNKDVAKFAGLGM